MDLLGGMMNSFSSLGGAMSQNGFSRMRSKYDNFAEPEALIKINNKSLKSESGLIVIYVDTQLSTGFEASCATFHVVMRNENGAAFFDDAIIDQYFMLGAKAEIELGYGGTLYSVFVGYISSLSYALDSRTGKHLVVECLDAKGLMMNNLTVAQRKELGYDQAVRAIAAQYGSYMNGMSIDSTGTLDGKIEITGASDYEFIVSAAKRVGFMFYILNGKLIFGKPKKQMVALTLDDLSAAEFFDIRFDLTGLAKSVEIRGTDDAKGKVISGKATSNAKFSRGGYAAKVLGKANRVYIDETVDSAQEAKEQAQVRLNEINSHFGELKWETNGLPELFPGSQLGIDLGCKDLKRSYNIDKVYHRISNNEFTTQIEARVEKL